MNRTSDLYLPQIRAFVLILALMSLCLLPLIVVDTFKYALLKLHLSPFMATVSLFGILLGGAVNFPIYRFNREDDQFVPTSMFDRNLGWVPLLDRRRQQSILAVNLGGCLIPVLLAAYEFLQVWHEPVQVRMALLLAVALNIYACYRIARPMPGIGIALPAFIPPLLAVGSSWLLLAPDDYREVRAPVAFIAGVLGPLVGADLLNLNRFKQVSAGVISIGGAGTFDGIVVSGLLAALLA